MKRILSQILNRFLITLGFLTLLMPQSVHAQNADIDWGDAGAPSLGTFPDGTTVTGSDGTTATVTRTISTDGGTFTNAAFAGDFLSYFAGQIGAGVQPLLLNFDNSDFDPDDRVTYDIVLSRAVTNFNFTLSDVDTGTNTDAIEVFFDDDLVGTFTNASSNPAFFTTGPSVTQTSNAVVNGWVGTGASGQFTTDGDIAFDFNNVPVRRIRVVYFSNTGPAGANPSGQFVGLSTLTYDAEGTDLSLTKQLLGSPPISGGTATWRLVVTNSSSSTAMSTGVVVQDNLPASFSLSSTEGSGTFDVATSQWTVPDLEPGESASITLTGTVSAAAGSTVTNTAEIIAADQVDPDSTVNNGVAAEDDFASSSFTVQVGRSPGVPPILSCPAGKSIFDWDTIPGWTPGTISNSYAFLGFGDIDFSLTNDGVYIDNAAFGGQSPNVGATFEGGLTPGEDTLTIVADQADQNGEVEIEIVLPRSFIGLQFSIFDVDFGAGQFADRVEVVGTFNGATVLPTLTNGNVNINTTSNEIIGDGVSDSDAALGNVVVTFSQEVDTVIITYGNHTTAPLDPGLHGLGVHDIIVCDPFTTLSVSKVSSIIADPVNGTTNPKAIPGATVEYLITVDNVGSSATDADSVVVLDQGPTDAKLCLISRTGGPIIFAEGGAGTGLTFTFDSLSSSTDDLEFSNDGGVSFNYTPIADAEGCDTAITDFRVNPTGAFTAGQQFTITVRYQVE